MKKIVFFLLIFIFGFNLTKADIFSGGGLENDSIFEKATRKGERDLLCGSTEQPIKIVSFINYPPFGWKDSKIVKNAMNDIEVSQYYGIGVELFKKFAKDYDLHFSFTNMLNYKEAEYALSLGYFDVMVADLFNPSGYQNVGYYHPGYISNPIVIVSLKSNPQQPESLKDLVGKTGYVRKEEIFYDIFQHSIPKGINIKPIYGQKKAFYDLLKKKVDFVLMSRYAFETEARRFKVLDFLTYSKPVFSPYIFMSYSKNSSCSSFIKNWLEESLKKYQSDEVFIKSVLSSQLGVWEKKFEKERSLMFETGELDEDVEQKTENLDAWLEEQRKKEEEKEAKEKEKAKARIGF